MKGRRQTFLTKFLKVKIFAGTRIRTHNLPAQSFFIRAEPSRQALAPSGLHSLAPTSSYQLVLVGPNSGCYSHCFIHQQSNPDPVVAVHLLEQQAPAMEPVSCEQLKVLE